MERLRVAGDGAHSEYELAMSPLPLYFPPVQMIKTPAPTTHNSWHPSPEGKTVLVFTVSGH